MMLGSKSPNVAHLYGPAVRCKLNLQNGNGWSCASVYGPCVEQIAPGHHGYPRAFDLIQRSALEGQLGHQITNATVRPFSMVNRLSNTAALFMALAGGWPTSCTSKVCRECAMAEADSRAARRLIS